MRGLRSVALIRIPAVPGAERLRTPGSVCLATAISSIDRRRRFETKLTNLSCLCRALMEAVAALSGNITCITCLSELKIRAQRGISFRLSSGPALALNLCYDYRWHASFTTVGLIPGASAPSSLSPRHTDHDNASIGLNYFQTIDHAS